MNTKTLRILATSAALATSMAYAAPDPWEGAFTVQIGGYNPQAETTVRLDSASGRFGTQVSFEGDLGGENRKTVPTFDMLWRFNPRHAMELSAVSLRRDGQTTLRGTIDFGDRTFPINTPIESEFNSDIVRLAYRWSPIHDDRAELGLLLGIHYTRMETSLKSTGSAAVISDSASVDFPLPTIGIRGNARIGDNWRVTGYGQFLKLKIGDYEGDIQNWAGGLEWFFGGGMFLGVGYDYYKYKLDSTKDNSRGSFKYTFDGPKVYFGWNFR